MPAPLRFAAVLGATLLLAGCAATTTSGADGTDAPSSSPDVAATEHPTVDSGTELGIVPEPLPPGEVTAQGLVLDRGTGPELCLGAIAESYPPQCAGPAIDGWDWDAIDGWEEASGQRFGSYAVQGTFHGGRFAVTTAPISLALYDPAPVDEPPLPTGTVTDEEAARLYEVLDAALGDRHLFSSLESGVVILSVLYDDGTLQQHLDAVYGPNVVHVTSALVDVQA